MWQRAMDLAEYTYSLIGRLPQHEKYALSDQMRRAAVSIPSNIAEGRGRDTDKEYIYFLVVTRGSKFDLETQILICERLHYITAEET
ncbi:four helix bundle protein [Ruminococcus flavefaciens]|uniref:four helix bundle protein n=1 Tax=Ruminococcus flavefaciens TaxID=1265 RepID=UPI00093308C4|nr:four helix bundle protein [Ruminococcus flavefaciens]